MSLFFSNLQRLKDEVIKKLDTLLSSGEIIPELTAEQLYDKMFSPLISEYGRFELLTQKIIEDKFGDVSSAIEDNADALGLNKDAIDLVKGVLDNIKTKTDNLDALSSTLGTSAKQDLLKGVMDSVKSGTDKIVADGATEAKQDSIISKTGQHVSVSDDVLMSHDAEVTHSTDTYTKVLEFKILLYGEYRITFDAWGTGNNNNKARMYINGGSHPDATLWDLDVGDPVARSEDLIYEHDDLCQLYLYGLPGPPQGTAHVTNFKVKGSIGLLAGVEKPV